MATVRSSANAARIGVFSGWIYHGNWRIGSMLWLTLALLVALLPLAALADDGLNLTRATIVTRTGAAVPLPERTAATVLTEEVAKRTGVKWEVAHAWPASGPAIALLSGSDRELFGRAVPRAARIAKAEGYGIVTDVRSAEHPIIWIVGADPRGALFGAGRLLRNLACAPSAVRLISPLNLTTSPDHPIRGHQLGYRATANSYDAWSPQQFDQYIRELALFGTNAIEGIPFQDTRPTVSSYPRDKMNVDISRICERYGLEYWIWVPADFDLGNADLRAKFLKRHEELFKACPVMTGIFMAGGDPGDNPAKLVIPYLEDLASVLRRTHPEARVWLSLQGWEMPEQDAVYRWLDREKPAWLGGIVAGPSSPPLAELRPRVPARYRIRDYPDITHNTRCQFPVPWWDPAFAFTEGRECINPRPAFYSRVIHDTAPFTDGFISYSDGCHDDVNKIVWSALEWDGSTDLNTLLAEYCRVFFGSDVAETAAAGIFAFEKSWQGAVATNGGIDANFALWQKLEAENPGLKSNWRWQMCLLRAYYDLYVRCRQRYESHLEDEANAQMLAAPKVGSETAVKNALATLALADSARVRQDLSQRVEQLCDDLFKSIGLQTSVAKYQAAGLERGAVLDFLYYPLNNRWWLEDELAKVDKLPTESERIARLDTLAKWAHPGPGSFYDDIGNVANSPDEVRYETPPGPLLDVDNNSPGGMMFWVDKDALARARQSWFTDEGWPIALKYPHVDPESNYLIRTTGCGECLLRVNGVRLAPTLNGKKVGEIKEFPVPRGLYRDGSISVTFDPTFEPELNWRVQSRLTEIWLIKLPGNSR
jgi:hypothetical protein